MLTVVEKRRKETSEHFGLLVLTRELESTECLTLNLWELLKEQHRA